MGLFTDFLAKSDSTKVQIDVKNGLHLRPCAKIAKLAKDFKSSITFVHLDKKADAKNMNEVLALSLAYGDEVVLLVKGKDSREAILQIKNLFREIAIEDSVEVALDYNQLDDGICCSYEGEHINGVAICRGVAIGELHTAVSSNTNGTKLSFVAAYQSLADELKRLSNDEDNSQRDIFLAQSSLLDALPKESLDVFNKSIDDAIVSLQGSSNESKIADYSDIKHKIKAKMSGEVKVDLPSDNFILLAREIFPSDIKIILNSGIKGIILENISTRSHVALLLRSYNIPAISVDNINALNTVSGKVILDTNSNLVVINPTQSDFNEANNALKNIEAKLIIDNSAKNEDAVTTNGKRVKVLANITDYESALEAKESGCEGVGLLRSEFLFQSIKPSVEQQRIEYEKIFSLFDEVTVRTLDVGGDKKLPYLTLPHEDNPFLGIRGVRLFKTHLELMKEQLGAILHAKQSGKVKIMFPMVATVEEFIYAKSVAIDIASEQNIDLNGISFGIMVEVPSVLFLVKEFDKVVDFYSIGTNDLSQYLFAIERTHTSLQIDPYSDVLYDAIKMLVNNSCKPLSICGEIASDINAIERLIDIGIDTLSVTPLLAPSIKSRIRNV